jgi:TrmH family RNA methyltransferase
MQQIERISKAKISDLAKLKQKKHRQEQQLIVLEGKRLAEQLKSYGILPREQYLSEAEAEAAQGLRVNSFICKAEELHRICDSEHPAEIAGLYSIPLPKTGDFRKALYLDRVSDPGNLGTIFRTVAAFGIDAIFISPDSCEVANPKVVRASMGAVYKVPWRVVSSAELMLLPAIRLVLDMNGRIELKQYQPSGQAEIYILGSEAHGVDPELMASADESLRIPMPGKMESLNLAISAAILCYQISR